MLIEILCTRTNAEIREIVKCYKERKLLSPQICSSLSEHTLEYLLAEAQHMIRGLSVSMTEMYNSFQMTNKQEKIEFYEEESSERLIELHDLTFQFAKHVPNKLVYIF